MKILLFVIVLLLTVGLYFRVTDLAMARKVFLKQRQSTDFTKAEPFLYKASPEKKRCLLIHGTTGSTHELRGLALYLQERGVTCYCPKLLGHGTSFYDVEKYGMKDWYAQVKDAAAREHYDYIVGLCSGANLAVDLAVENHYEKIVLISPLFRFMPNFLGQTWTFLLPIIKPFYPYYLKEKQPYEDLIAYDILPLANLYDLDRYNRRTLRKLGKIDCPALILFGEKDDLYRPGLPQELNRSIRGSKLYIHPHGQHVLTMIDEKEAVFKKIKDFLLP